ncbi:NAD(P)/FAD-dependent oxidoreductase [Streptomyces sp. GSL17-111]|uniref:NAD(P)/FAD-dependent oxidoreductase n=1 Tax=Streptomyces sp. GSL17-111 TaxID=3121596 RepID=UPI0030F3BB92
MTPAPPTDAVRAADPAERYDVAVLGGTLAAGLLGAVLARQGVRVLLVGAADDRSAPSGETTVPYTAEVFLLLAKRFDVPEIAAFGLFPDLPAEVRRTSGVKKSLGFLHHHAGRRHDPAESVQFNVPGEHAEWHLYRPEVDAYALRIAARHGAALVPRGVTVTDAEAGPDGGEVRASDGRTYRARYLVDCSGDASPLVRRAGGDDAVPRLTHRSVSYAAHLRGVTPFEDVVPLHRHPKATAWSEGTVHHLFDGGWLQLVHFGNHRSGENPLTSVTLSVAPEVAAELPDDPEKAFRTVVERYPDLARQFDTASPVRPWTAHVPTQRTAARTHGERWFALERSAARTDLFLSRDVTTAAELVHALAGPLITAVRRDDFAPEPFARVARFQEELGAWNDRLLAAARTACRDFRLWNAFSRVWLLWQILADLSLKRARLDCEQSGSWAPVERFELGGIWFHAPEGLRELVGRSLETIAQVRDGRRDAATAASAIFADLRRAPFVPPLYAFGDPGARVYHFTFPKRLRMLLWVKTKAPADFRRLLTRDNVTSVTSATSR